MMFRVTSEPASLKEDMMYKVYKEFMKEFMQIFLEESLKRDAIIIYGNSILSEILNEPR